MQSSILRHKASLKKSIPELSGVQEAEGRAPELIVGSLFSGVGGIEKGLEEAGGFRTIWAVEKELYCQAVLRERFPGIKIYDDIRTLPYGTIARVDVLTGGFPCQDISVAGKGAGIEEGTRSGLWSYFLLTISILRPKYVIVENVAALLIRGIDRVLGDLAAIGYDAEWHCIPASAIGAPQRRDRIFILCYPNHDGSLAAEESAGTPSRSNSSTTEPLTAGEPAGSSDEYEELADSYGSSSGRLAQGEEEGSEGKPLPAPAGCGGDVAYADNAGRREPRSTKPVRKKQPTAERSRQAMADRPSERCGETGELQCSESEERTAGSGQAVPSIDDPRERLHQFRGRITQWDDWDWSCAPPKPPVPGTIDGVLTGLDSYLWRERVKALGNAVVPQVAQFIGERILEIEAGRI